MRWKDFFDVNGIRLTPLVLKELVRSLLLFLLVMVVALSGLDGSTLANSRSAVLEEWREPIFGLFGGDVILGYEDLYNDGIIFVAA